MTQVNSIKDISVGDIIKHQYRKTLTFIVTEKKGQSSFHIQRLGRDGNPDNNYKGYRLSAKDVNKDLVIMVKSAAANMVMMDSSKLVPNPVVAKMDVDEIIDKVFSVIKSLQEKGYTEAQALEIAEIFEAVYVR